MQTNVIPFNQLQNSQGNLAIPLRETRAATRTGRAEQEIEQLPFDLSILEEEGVFINVDATGFGLLDRRLDWQALGIELPKNTDVNFTPPRCGLLPNRYRRPLLAPVARAHAALRKFSYQFRLTETLFETPAYRWVPWRAYTEFETSFQQALDNLNLARQNVLDHYEDIRLEVLTTFRRIAVDSEQRLNATDTLVSEDFVERVVRGVLSAFPTRDELQEKLQLRYQVGVILLGSEMLREQRLAAEERQRLAQTEIAARASRANLRLVEQATQQQIWEEQERSRQQLAAEAEERQREAEVKERLRQMKIDAAQEKLRETLSPLQEGAAQLRSLIYDSAQSMLEALQKNDFMPGATAKKARHLAEWFRLMNFQSDTELDQLLRQLEQLASKPSRRSKHRASNAMVKAALDDIIQLCYRDANAVTAPNRIAALEF